MLAYREWHVARTNQIVWGMYHAPIRASFLFFDLRCSNFNEVMGDSERAVRKIESPFRMRNIGFSVFLTCILPRFMRKMRYYWTDERYQITHNKRVTHAVKMVDSCSRENGVLCTVARSWLLFLHDEIEWKNFNQILLEVLMNCTKHFDLNSS